ncbi:MAG TPA: biotin/lipoyl-binding protein [Planctomycetota bacterium]|nr:biotin/lipoyl-binding protein [Planctomycetota bacterium]
MPRRRRTWALWIGIVLLALAAGAAWRFQDVFRAVEVETVRPIVTMGEGPAAGTPVLTASGYVVARRKAVVSAKIQGRLSDLRVEEGSRVKKGDINGLTGATGNVNFSELAFAFRVTPEAIGAGLLFAVTMGALGGLLPAVRAALLPISAALREG